jgi:hypothetical protein
MGMSHEMDWLLKALMVTSRPKERTRPVFSSVPDP